jgi:hypothetical protein
MSLHYLSFFNLNKSTNKAQCTLCPPTAKLLAFTDTSKTNLKKHLDSCHKEAVKEKEKEWKPLNPFSVSKSNTNMRDSEQLKITDAVVDFVIDNDEPLSLVERKPFRKLMSVIKPSWKPVCKKTVRTKIVKKGGIFPFKCYEYQKEYGKPSATVDIWTSKQRLGYMAVSLHVNTPKKLITKCMDCRYISSPHTAEDS